MRRLNGILAITILIVFIVHGVLGALNMMEITAFFSKIIPRILICLIGLHAAVSTGYTIHSLRVAKRTNAPYFKENRLFWAGRISGLLIIALILFHVTAFGAYDSGVFRLVPFDLYRLIAQLLFLTTVAVHIISNVKPALITLGVRKLKQKAGNILFFISALLLFMTAAFILYYVKWQM